MHAATPSLPGGKTISLKKIFGRLAEGIMKTGGGLAPRAVRAGHTRPAAPEETIRDLELQVVRLKSILAQHGIASGIGPIYFHPKTGGYYERIGGSCSARDGEAETLYLHIWPKTPGLWTRLVPEFEGIDMERGHKRFIPVDIEAVPDEVRTALWSRLKVDPQKGPAADPIPMLLFCPACDFQHVDAPQPDRGWTNPAHRSHECQACGHVWRPADIATTGVIAIGTRGQRDGSPIPSAGRPALACQTAASGTAASGTAASGTGGTTANPAGAAA